MSARFWLNLQEMHDLWHAAHGENAKAIARLRPLSKGRLYMKPELFDELLESIRQRKEIEAGRMRAPRVSTYKMTAKRPEAGEGRTGSILEDARGCHTPDATAANGTPARSYSRIF